MRASISAQGITAEAETFPDGTVTVVLTNSHGYTLAAGTWHSEAEQTPTLRPAEAWPASA